LVESSTASNLVPESQVAETAPFDATLVDFRLGPHEPLGRLIVGLDEGIDMLLQCERGHSTTLRSALGIVMFPSLLSNGGRSQPVEWAA